MTRPPPRSCAARGIINEMMIDDCCVWGARCGVGCRVVATNLTRLACMTFLLDDEDSLIIIIRNLLPAARGSEHGSSTAAAAAAAPLIIFYDELLCQ